MSIVTTINMIYLQKLIIALNKGKMLFYNNNDFFFEKKKNIISKYLKNVHY